MHLYLHSAVYNYPSLQTSRRCSKLKAVWHHAEIIWPQRTSFDAALVRRGDDPVVTSSSLTSFRTRSPDDDFRPVSVSGGCGRREAGCRASWESSPPEVGAETGRCGPVTETCGRLAAGWAVLRRVGGTATGLWLDDGGRIPTRCCSSFIIIPVTPPPPPPAVSPLTQTIHLLNYFMPSFKLLSATVLLFL